MPDIPSAVRELVERYDCPEIRSARFRRSGDLLRVTIDGSAVTAGTPRRPVRLPPAWVIETGPNGEIRDIAVAERVVARQFLNAREQWDATALRDPELDPLLLIHEIADEATEQVALDRDHGQLDYALAMSRQYGDTVTEEFCLRMKSTLLRLKGKYAEAAPVAREAIAVAERAGDADGMATGLFTEGLAYWYLDDRPKAYADLLSAAANPERLDDPRIAMKSMVMFAHIHMANGDFADGIEATRRMAELAERYGWMEGTLASYFHLASLHDAIGDPDNARFYYRKAYELSRLLGKPLFMLDALVSAAAIDADEGNFEAAEPPLRQALTLLDPNERHPEMGVAQSHLAGVLIQRRQFAEAETLLQAALRNVSDGPSVSNVLVGMSNLRLLQHRPDEALRLAGQAIAASKRPAIDMLNASGWQAYFTKARALLASGRTDEAASTLRDAVAIVEKRRAEALGDRASNAGFFYGQSAPYSELTDVLVGQGKVREAFAVAEQMRARSLLDALQQGHVDAEALMSDAERKTEHASKPTSRG